MDPEEKIIKVASEAAGLDCSRALDERRRAVYENLLALLEEKKRRLKDELAEKSLQSIENKAAVELLKQKFQNEQKYLESRRQYHEELLKRMAMAQERRRTLFMIYQDMKKRAEERWESYLEVYNRRPLAKKKAELENKLKFAKFQALCEAQRQENLQWTIERLKQMHSLIRETREREKERLVSEVLSYKAKIEELDHFKKQKEELLAQLKAEKAAKDRENQKLSQIKTAGPVSLPFGQLSLSDYRAGSQPVLNRMSHLSSAETYRVPVTSLSQSGVVMSVNRREIHSRIIEERCFVVVTSPPVSSNSSAPAINLQNNSTPEDVNMAHDFAPLVTQETTTHQETGHTHNTERILVDPGYGGSSSPQDSVRDIFSLDDTPEMSPSRNSQVRNGQLPSSAASLVLPTDSLNFPQSAMACSYDNFQTRSSKQPVLTRSISRTNLLETTADAQNMVVLKSTPSQPHHSSADTNHHSTPATLSQKPILNSEVTNISAQRTHICSSSPSLPQISSSSHQSFDSPTVTLSASQTQSSLVPAVAGTQTYFVSPLPTTSAYSPQSSVGPPAFTTHTQHFPSAPMTHSDLVSSATRTSANLVYTASPAHSSLISSVIPTPYPVLPPPPTHPNPVRRPSQAHPNFVSPAPADYALVNSPAPSASPSSVPQYRTSNVQPARSSSYFSIQRNHPYNRSSGTTPNTSAIATVSHIQSGALPVLSTSALQTPGYPSSQPAPVNPSAIQNTLAAEQRNVSSQPVPPVPAMSPSVLAVDPTLQESSQPLTSNNSSPPPPTSNQSQMPTLGEPQHLTETEGTEAGNFQAEIQTSHYFNKPASPVAYQEALANPHSDGSSKVVDETYLDQDGQTREEAHDFQQLEYASSELGEDSIVAPRFGDDESDPSSPHQLLKSPTSPPLPEEACSNTGTGFGGLGFSFPSFFGNPFGSSISNNAAANSVGAGQREGAFSFTQAPSNNPFKLF